MLIAFNTPKLKRPAFMARRQGVSHEQLLGLAIFNFRKGESLRELQRRIPAVVPWKTRCSMIGTLVATSKKSLPGKLVPTMLWRKRLGLLIRRGRPMMWKTCAFPWRPLSKGFIQSDRVCCPYHGWNYDGTRQWCLMPAFAE